MLNYLLLFLLKQVRFLTNNLMNSIVFLQLISYYLLWLIEIFGKAVAYGLCRV